MNNPDVLNLVIACLGAFAFLYACAFIPLLITVLMLRYYRLKPLPNTRVFRSIRETFETTDDWVKRFGFHYLGIYGGTLNKLALWENAKKSTVLSLTLDNPKPDFRFQAVFDGNIRLETANNKTALMLPYPPGHYIQAFQDESCGSLWRRHLEAESWLIEHENVRLISFHPDFPWGSNSERTENAAQILLTRAVRSRGKYLLRSFGQFFLLPFTMLYRRFFWSGKPVRQLVERGHQPSPDALPSDRDRYAVAWPENFECSLKFSVDTPPDYSDSNPSVPFSQGFIRTYLAPGLIACLIIGTLGFLMFSAIHVPSPTEETLAGEQEFRQHLFDFEYEKARQTADTIAQPYWREKAYFHLACQQAETEQFAVCRETMKSIVGKCHRYHSPPIVWIMQRRLITALAADDRFEEAENILRDNSLSYGSSLPVCRYYLAAGKPQDALRLLQSESKSDPYFETLRDTVAHLARQGEFDTAMDVAAKMELDGWQHGAYREIVRESLIRNKPDRAIQVFDRFVMYRYRQQAAALFMIWHLQRGESEDALKLYEQYFVDPEENARIDKENKKEPGSSHEDWKRQNAIRQKLPYGHDDWRRISQTIFQRFGYEMEADKIGALITGSNRRSSHVTITPLPPEPTKTATDQDDIERRIEENLANIRRYSAGNEQDQRLYHLLQSVFLYRKQGDGEKPSESLREYRAEFRTMELPNPFYPEYQQESRKRFLSVLLDVELLLEQFDEAEKTVRRFGITNTMDTAMAHVKTATALRAAGRESEAKKHARLAWKFARRIDYVIPKQEEYTAGVIWPQNTPEIVALPELLDSLDLPEERDEAKERLAAPPKFRLLRFLKDADFSFPKDRDVTATKEVPGHTQPATERR